MQKYFFIFLFWGCSILPLDVFSSDVKSEVALDSLIQSSEEKLEQVQYYTGTADYPKAYDQIWYVLSVANTIQNHDLMYKAYQRLAMLYSIFHQKEKAIASIDSMFYHAEKSKDFHLLRMKKDLHFSSAITYRMNERYDLAQKELSICDQLQDSLQIPMNERVFVLAEKALLSMSNGNYNKSEAVLKEISKYIDAKSSYNSIIHSIWGDLYVKKGDKQKARYFYNKSLEAISLHQERIGLKVEVLEKISELNYQLGDYKTAYLQMTETKQLGDLLFGSQSNQNSHLIEIKDSYRNALIAHQKVQKAQQIQLLETEKEKLQQRLIFSLILVCIVIGAAFYIFRLIRRKHSIEKKFVEEQGKKDLEIKKKELLATALQLMEKDKVLDEIKLRLEKIKEENDYTSVDKIRSTISVNTTRTWEEFEARFVQVNTTFYESLNEKHPNLSPNERKLCALIKLNFSSKEMAELLGVTSDSINKARYRLRKKLQLNREDNLEIYVGNI